MIYRIKRFVSKLIKICKYIPILWKDEDWDYSYLLDLLAYKLIRIKNCIRSNNIIVGEDIREISIYVNQVLDHIHNYQNSDEAYDNLYGEPSFEIGHVTVPAENNCVRMISINKEANRALSKEEDEEYINYIKAKYEFEQKEWNAIWDTIKEHGQRWWE